MLQPVKLTERNQSARVPLLKLKKPQISQIKHG